MSGMNNLNRKRPIRFAKEKMNKHAMNHDEKKKEKNCGSRSCPNAFDRNSRILNPNVGKEKVH